MRWTNSSLALTGENIDSPRREKLFHIAYQTFVERSKNMTRCLTLACLYNSGYHLTTSFCKKSYSSAANSDSIKYYKVGTISYIFPYVPTLVGPPPTTTNVSRRVNSSGDVPGLLARSKHSISRLRIALESLSCFRKKTFLVPSTPLTLKVFVSHPAAIIK